jgi:hypothetical protein
MIKNLCLWKWYKPTLANDTFHTGKEKQGRPASNLPPPYRPTQTRPDTTSPPTTT